MKMLNVIVKNESLITLKFVKDKISNSKTATLTWTMGKGNFKLSGNFVVYIAVIYLLL